MDFIEKTKNRLFKDPYLALNLLAATCGIIVIGVIVTLCGLAAIIQAI